MKIIGKTNTGVIAELTNDEFQKVALNYNAVPAIGLTCPLSANYDLLIALIGAKTKIAAAIETVNTKAAEIKAAIAVLDEPGNGKDKK